jgi:Tetratricopeptide repeat
MSQAPSVQDPGMPLAVVLGLLAADAPRQVMGTPEDWPRWAVLLPHVLAATGHFKPLPAPQDQPGRQEDSWLLDRAAIYLQVHARLDEARPLAERAVAITEAAYGPDHSNVGIRLTNLAAIWRDLGQPEQARPLAERALTWTRLRVPFLLGYRSKRWSLGQPK